MSRDKNAQLKLIKRRLLPGLLWSMLLLIMHGAKGYDTDVAYRGGGCADSEAGGACDLPICLPPEPGQNS